MKYFIIASVLFFISCVKKHDGVDDEYSRGFFNALSIMEHRFKNYDSDNLPYWNECKRSYLSKSDLFNNWDSSYLNNINLIAPVSTFDTIYLGYQPLFRDTSGTKLDSIWVPLGTPIAYKYIDTLPDFNNSTTIRIQDYDNGVERTIYQNGDTVISVYGDSLTAIKLLFKYFQMPQKTVPKCERLKLQKIN